MKLSRFHNVNRCGNAADGFTMIEIALCLAIIGFALVAIIGILPAGMQVQRDNREDTIINQDATYWMETIRNGEQWIGELTNFVDSVMIVDDRGTNTFNNFANSWEIIGLLTTPWTVSPIKLATNYAIVRAFSGPAAEKGADPNVRDLAFKYLLRVDNREFVTGYDPYSPDAGTLANRLHELRLSFAWPVLAGGRTGNSRQVLRTLVSAENVAVTNNNQTYWFFHH